MYINQAFDFDTIFNYENYIAHKQNIMITNISYWNSSRAYQEYMRQVLVVEPSKDYFNYTYSQDLAKEMRDRILRELTGGRSPRDAVLCLLTSSSTCSITNMINFLKLTGYRKLCILTPAYFTPEENCRIFGQPYEKIPLPYADGKYEIPMQQILDGGFDALWVTSPVYSTGVLYDEQQVAQLQELMDRDITVIADETLALPGQELARQITIGPRFYSILSPHKPLFINGLKFSAILHPRQTDNFFEQWVDVLGGALTQSNVTAAYHYLSDNYQVCVEHSREWYLRSMETVSRLVAQFPMASCDNTEISPYKTVYLRAESKDLNNLSNTKDLIKTNFVSYIPGIYNDFDHAFRINMSLEPSVIEDALFRILNYFES